MQNCRVVRDSWRNVETAYSRCLSGTEWSSRAWRCWLWHIRVVIAGGESVEHRNDLARAGWMALPVTSGSGMHMARQMMNGPMEE